MMKLLFSTLGVFLFVLSLVLFQKTDEIISDIKSVPVSGRYLFRIGNEENYLYLDFRTNTYKQNIYVGNKLLLKNSGSMIYSNYANEVKLFDLYSYNKDKHRVKTTSIAPISDGKLIIGKDGGIVFRKSTP